MKKWEKFLLWWFVLACFFVLLPFGGCGVKHKYINYHTLKTPIYAATLGDVKIIGTALFGESRGSMVKPGDFILFMPLAVIDIPLAVVIDTVTLPIDGYVAYQNQRIVLFWEKAFKTGTIPVNTSLDSYLKNGGWFDYFLRTKIQGSPPPNKEIIDHLITLSCNYNSTNYREYLWLIESLANCKSLSSEQVERIYFWEVNENKQMNLYALLNLPAMTDELFEKIGQSTNENALLPLLASERTPLHISTNIISRLIDSPNWKTRGCVAQNPNTSSGQLLCLALDQHEKVRDHVAWNPNATAGALLLLAKNGNASVRKQILRHPNVTPSIEVYIKQQLEKKE